MKVRSLKSHEQNPVDMPGSQGAKMRMLIGPEDGATNFHMRHFEVEAGGWANLPIFTGSSDFFGVFCCPNQENETFFIAVSVSFKTIFSTN